MRPQAILGFDPAPADPVSLARLPDGLHKVIRGLVEGRAALDRLGPAGSVWDGALGAPVVELARRFSHQVDEMEQALIGCLTALDGWRIGSEERRAEVANLVEIVAGLGTEDGAADRRDQLVATARDIASDHHRAARDLAAAFAELSTIAEHRARAAEDQGAELEAALRALAAAVEGWVEVEGPELVRTATALGEVAALTTVISELVGVAALDRTPGDGAGVRDVISRSPGAHRLIKALHQRWLEVAPTNLPEATFALARRSDLAESIVGRLSGGLDVGPEPDDVTGTSATR